MKLASAITAVLLAVLWTVVGMHCQLEMLTGLEFLQCEAPQQSSSPDSHCTDNDCVTIEQGHYLLSQKAPLNPVPPVVLLPVLIITTAIAPESFESDCLVSETAAPPRPWQFFARAALSPRAPSFAS